MKARIKHIVRSFSAALICAATILPAAGQTAKSGYFLPGMLNRNKINPAVINSRGYIGIPILSDINVGVRTNMGAGKFIFPMNGGGLTTFMNGSVSANDFLSGLADVTTLNADFSTDILGFGFYAGQSYNTAGLSLRSVSGANIPYALFDFMKSGMDSPEGANYSIKNLEVQTTNYAELFWSYARPINHQWSVGGKVKFLLGLGDARANISQMDISMSSNEWVVSSEGYMDGSAILPLKFKTGTNGAVSSFDTGNGLNISNFGVAFDLGTVYKPSDRWTVSLGVVDLGFIHWGGVISARTNAEPFHFTGFNNLGDGNINDQIKEMENQLKELINFYPENGGTTSSRNSMLKATINIGGEYEIVDDMFSVGLLSSTRISKTFTLTEAIFSANYRPSDSWFNAAVTLDVSNIAVSGGIMLNFCPSFLNLFVGADFILYKMTPQFIPMRSAAPMISFGLNIPIGCKNKL